MDAEEEALIRTIVSRRTDTTARLVYADWLEERGHRGAAYLRAEVALAQAKAADAPRLRRSLLKTITKLPREWRDRFEQPDLLLAPPVPFKPGWYRANVNKPKPYHSLSNLPAEGLSHKLPWLLAENAIERVEGKSYASGERAIFAQVKRRAEKLRLKLPRGFEEFALDIPRRLAICQDGYHEILFDDWTGDDFPQVEEGHLILFFANMDYGASPQLSWALYIVPGVNWHCVVSYPIADGDEPLPELNRIVYCAPSFQAFLYRWWCENEPS